MKCLYLHVGGRGVEVSKAAKVTLLHAVLTTGVVRALNLAVAKLVVSRPLPVVEITGCIEIPVELPEHPHSNKNQRVSHCVF
jgi:hypothetical protein